MTNGQRDVLNLIKVLRKSFEDAKIVYLFGACYGFYEILKHSFPESIAYMVDDNHVITKIGADFYDVCGIYIFEKGEIATKMDENKHYIAESWKDGQRLERMLKKYSDIN